MDSKSDKQKKIDNDKNRNELKNKTLFFYDYEWAKIRALGGAKWIRELINKTKV